MRLYRGNIVAISTYTPEEREAAAAAAETAPPSKGDLVLFFTRKKCRINYFLLSIFKITKKGDDDVLTRKFRIGKSS